MIFSVLNLFTQPAMIKFWIKRCFTFVLVLVIFPALASRWSRQNIRVFNKTGKLLEKYNVIDTTLQAGGGEYPNQDGFGWTNGVLLKILKPESEKK